MASNVETIAESKFEPDILRAIYLNQTVIGMLSYSMEDVPIDPEVYWLSQFTIERDFQNHGYGTKALELIFKEISCLGGKKIYTTHKSTNEVAGKLDRKVGFSYNGELQYGEPLM